HNLEVSLPGVKSIKADLYDLTGRLVATVKEAADTAVINLDSIGSGLYIVRVNDSQSIKITI
ncbi:MAG: T9SS type A sorting domain-containing protein, partial [Muribaculaceae bacterium]|nr:T9SS type A sorting domain-containing protein [Muribaculaceae bacterium]